MTIRSSDFGGGFDAWSPNKTYPPDKVVVSLLTGALCQSLNSVGPSATDPSNDSTNWSVLAGAPGTLKSVQRGVAASGNTNNNVVISISAVNPLKCMVTVQTGRTGAPTFISPVRVVSLTSTQLTVTPGYSISSGTAYSSDISWEIAEYY